MIETLMIKQSLQFFPDPWLAFLIYTKPKALVTPAEPKGIPYHYY